MVDVRAFRALRPGVGAAERLVSPPYDVVDVEEARAYAGGDPDSFLRVSRPEIDLAADVDAHSDEVYALGRRNLDELVARGVLVRDERPTFSVYRQVMGDVRQTGIVGAVVGGRLRRRARAHPRAHAARQGARPRPPRRRARRAGRAGVPALAPARPTSTRSSAGSPSVSRDRPRRARRRRAHPLGRSTTPRRSTALRRALARGGRPLRRRRPPPQRRRVARARGCGSGRPGTHDAFLAVVFPLDDVHVMAYNRVVADLRGRTPEQLVAEVADGARPRRAQPTP